MPSRHWRETALLVLAWGAAIAFVRPFGNFPIVDDWDFAIATWRFARTGHFQFTPFTAMSLRSLVVWGAAWTRLFGESFEVLRAATLTLGAATLVVLHRLLVRASLPRVARVVATLAFAFHPVFLWTSCTYMSEVPFVFASLVTLVCFWRAIAEEREAWLVAGCVMVAVSWFVRQTGVMTAVAAFAVVLLFRDALTVRWRRFAAILGATLATFALLLVFRREWLAGSPEEFASHYRMWREGTFRIDEQFAVMYHYAVFNVQNAALFFVPLVAGAAVLLRRRAKWEYAVFAAFALMLFVRVQSLVGDGHPLPYFSKTNCCDITSGNVLIDFGIGPATLLDTWAMGLPYPFALAMPARLALTYASVAAGALLLWTAFGALIRALADVRRNALLLLAAATVCCASAALAASGIYVDRYSFDSAWATVLVLALAIPWQQRAARIAAIATLVVTATFTTLGVQEYFAWNHARWAAFESLRASGVAASSIDAGTEPFNLYEIATMDRKHARRAVMVHPTRPFAIAFRPLPGYRVVATRPFAGFFGLRRGAIYTLERG